MARMRVVVQRSAYSVASSALSSVASRIGSSGMPSWRSTGSVAICFVDQRGLESDRARVEGVEQRHVAHRRQRDADQRARAIGDLRIDEVEQHVEVVLGRVLVRELAREAGRC